MDCNCIGKSVLTISSYTRKIIYQLTYKSSRSCALQHDSCYSCTEEENLQSRHSDLEQLFLEKYIELSEVAC